jgi:pimeloyl-ACP methyl ester carboxylesterase
MFVTPPRQKRRMHATNGAVSQIGEITAHRVDIRLRNGADRVSATTMGTGATVMLVHGWGGSARDMMPIAAAFALAGYRAVVFDMPGHGQSEGRESSLVEFLRAMRAVSGALGQPEIIIGHSFGGAAAVFGITELGLPVRAAVLISPAPGPAYYVDRFARTVGLPAERTDGMVRHLVERVGRSIESLDALVAARGASVPALIFHDPADREVPFEYAERMAAAWSGSRLVPAPSLGHKRILRDPETIGAALDFARSLTRIRNKSASDATENADRMPVA